MNFKRLYLRNGSLTFLWMSSIAGAHQLSRMIESSVTFLEPIFRKAAEHIFFGQSNRLRIQKM